jgi:hypothetical protein
MKVGLMAEQNRNGNDEPRMGGASLSQYQPLRGSSKGYENDFFNPIDGLFGQF